MDHHDIKNFSLLSTLIKEGDILVDVGTHNGTYTSFFKDILKGSGKIYSIELSQKTYQKLKEKFGSVENIILINKAVSEIDGQIPYYEANDSHLNNIMGHDVHYKKHSQKGLISSITLNELLKNDEKIKLIKIDVEGAEHFVLNGMDKIIEKVDYILVECHLEEYWGIIKKILLEKYSLTCINNSADSKDSSELNMDSKLMYQCFCKKSEK
jgi:FkbM family methyltransferase